MKKRFLAAVAATTLLGACGGGADPAEVVETIRITEQSQLASIESKDLVGIARLYADDATLVRPDGSVIEGGAAIADAYADLLEDPNFALSTEPRGGWASAADDLAVVTSNVDFTSTDPATGEAATQQMISQTVWTRQSGSTWKIVSAYNVPRVAPQADAQAEAEAPAAQAAPAAE